MPRFPAIGLVTALLALSGPPVGAEERLGTIHFPISCHPAAQREFDRGVALLHSFWYGAALRAFTEVTQVDPGCAMGFWGIAMSGWRPLWDRPGPASLRSGRQAVERARAAGARTDRELAYIAAIEVFYRDADRLDHDARAAAYEAAMERLHLRYPEDREAAVFYALALNAAASPSDRSHARQIRAGGILETVFAEAPDHPGAAHYLIHSYDSPPLAARGLDAARRYARIAPSSAHARHMPSHSFTRLPPGRGEPRRGVRAAPLDGLPRVRLPPGRAGRGGQADRRPAERAREVRPA
jgi:hypothetical protein